VVLSSRLLKIGLDVVIQSSPFLETGLDDVVQSFRFLKIGLDDVVQSFRFLKIGLDDMILPSKLREQAGFHWKRRFFTHFYPHFDIAAYSGLMKCLNVRQLPKQSGVLHCYVTGLR